MTSADVHDGQVFGQLLDGSESAVYADKAYESQDNRALLSEHKIKDCIMYKAKKNKIQPKWQVDSNKVWSSIRCNIERIFGCWKTQMGMSRARYRGWRANQVHFDLVGIAYNLNRAFSLLKI